MTAQGDLFGAPQSFDFWLSSREMTVRPALSTVTCILEGAPIVANFRSRSEASKAACAW